MTEPSDPLLLEAIAVPAETIKQRNQPQLGEMAMTAERGETRPASELA